MYAGKLVFAQVMEFAPWHTFRRLVTKYRGDFKTQSCPCHSVHGMDPVTLLVEMQLVLRAGLQRYETVRERRLAAFAPGGFI